MSVQILYSDEDTRRMRAAEKAKKSFESLRPRPKPLIYVVRWRQYPGGGQTSHRFHVKDFESTKEAADRAHDLDRKIRNHKRDNAGFALRHQVLNDASSADGTQSYKDYLRGPFLDYVLAELAPNTHTEYAKAIENRLINAPVGSRTVRGRKRYTYGPTTLGVTPINQITPALRTDWRVKLAAQGVGKRQVEFADEVLRSSLSYAVEELGLLKTTSLHQPVSSRRRKRVRRKDPLPPNRVVDPLLVETVRLVHVVRGQFRTALAISLLAYLGFRLSELIPRTWRDFLDENGVARPVVVIETTVSAGIERDVLKNRQSDRAVQVFAPIRAEIEEIYEALGRPDVDERVLVLEDGRDGLVGTEDLAGRIRRTQRALGVSFRPQDLRHTCVSLLGGGGDEEKGKPWTFTEIAEQLGHTPWVCAQIYSHVIKYAQYRGLTVEAVILKARADAVVARDARELRARALLAAGDDGLNPAEARERSRLLREFGYAGGRRRDGRARCGRTELGTMLAERLVRVGEPLFGCSKGREFEAVIDEHGFVRIEDGRAFASPTSAACVLCDYPRDGWGFWRVMRDGRPIPLDLLRGQLPRGHAGRARRT